MNVLENVIVVAGTVFVTTADDVAVMVVGTLAEGDPAAGGVFVAGAGVGTKLTEEGTPVQILDSSLVWKAQVDKRGFETYPGF